MVDHSMQSSVSHKSRFWLFGLLVLLIVLGLCWWLWPSAAKKAATDQPAGHTGRSGMMRPGSGGSTQPEPARVAEVTQGDFPIYYKALGTVTALNTINVRSRVAGELVKVYFKEGQMVKAG